MTSARSVIISTMDALCDGISTHSEDAERADAILAALDAAGFTPPLPKAMFKQKVNARALAHLDDMAEADIAMDGDHALSVLLAHYRELTSAKETT